MAGTFDNCDFAQKAMLSVTQMNPIPNVARNTIVATQNALAAAIGAANVIASVKNTIQSQIYKLATYLKEVVS